MNNTPKISKTEVALFPSDGVGGVGLTKPIINALAMTDVVSKGNLMQSPYGMLNNLCQQINAVITSSTVLPVDGEAVDLRKVSVGVDFDGNHYQSGVYEGELPESTLRGYAAVELLEECLGALIVAIKSHKLKRRELAGIKNKELRAVYPDYINDWCERWPDIFNKENPKPLSGSVRKEIGAMFNIPNDTLKFVFSTWVRRIQYNREILKNTHRYNLDGSTADLISAETTSFCNGVVKRNWRKRKSAIKCSKRLIDANLSESIAMQKPITS